MSGSLPPSQPSSLAVGGRDDDREVLEVVGALTRRGAVVGHPVVAEVDGLSGIAEDPIGGDHIADR